MDKNQRSGRKIAFANGAIDGRVRGVEAPLFRTHMNRSKSFWDKEYQTGSHLQLSEKPAEDLVKFARWLARREGKKTLNPTARVLDIGCGNGRNLIYLTREFGCRGMGIDSSDEAIRLAREGGWRLPLEFRAGTIIEPLSVPDSSIDLALDMMTSHVLREEGRARYLREIERILKPGGWLLFKTHLKEGDIHSRRLLKYHAADEKDSYIHPRLGVYEHVWSETEIREFFAPQFEIHKMLRSHKHILHGKAFKRRTVTVYLKKL